MFLTFVIPKGNLSMVIYVAIPSNRVNVSYSIKRLQEPAWVHLQVAIPSNRVNVSYLWVLPGTRYKKGESRNPLKSGQCFLHIKALILI